MSDLIVIIDNWKYKPDGTIVKGHLSANIIKFIETNPNITTAVLASYSCSKELFSDTIWYNNRKKSIENYHEYVKTDFFSNLTRKMQTWDALLNYVNPRIFQIAMRDIEELHNYVKSHDVKNIYMAGAAWEICVKNRPLGYENIRKNIPDVNIVVDVSCVVDSNSNIPNIAECKDWTIVSNTLYRYKS